MPESVAPLSTNTYVIAKNRSDRLCLCHPRSHLRIPLERASPSTLSLHSNPPPARLAPTTTDTVFVLRCRKATTLAPLLQLLVSQSAPSFVLHVGCSLVSHRLDTVRFDRPSLHLHRSTRLQLVFRLAHHEDRPTTTPDEDRLTTTRQHGSRHRYQCR
jgi:hypothetical protein